jgi:HEAT repeat protein
MIAFRKLILAALLISAGAPTAAQIEDSERLKSSALEALISAPPERALPIVSKVLSGDSSPSLKKRALFVLGQIDLPEAQTLLVETARTGDGSLRLEAIRMIGIGGHPEAMTELAEIYADGDGETREAVLQAYLIADDNNAVYQLAANTQDPEEFERAVNTLGAMGATDELRALRDRPGMAEVLINAYAIAGDMETLAAMANDSSDPQRQAQAIRGLAIAAGDGDDVGEMLVGIYRDTDVPHVRKAVREALLIADHDEAVLQLFRTSDDAAEKRELLQTLVMMDSDAVWDLIDSTLENGQ